MNPAQPAWGNVVTEFKNNSFQRSVSDNNLTRGRAKPPVPPRRAEEMEPRNRHTRKTSRRLSSRVFGNIRASLGRSNSAKEIPTMHSQEMSISSFNPLRSSGDMFQDSESDRSSASSHSVDSRGSCDTKLQRKNSKRGSFSGFLLKRKASRKGSSNLMKPETEITSASQGRRRKSILGSFTLRRKSSTPVRKHPILNIPEKKLPQGQPQEQSGYCYNNSLRTMGASQYYPPSVPQSRYLGPPPPPPMPNYREHDYSYPPGVDYSQDYSLRAPSW